MSYLESKNSYLKSKKLNEWLETGGVKGLSVLQLEDFSNTGYGVKMLQLFNSHNVILTVPKSLLWMADVAFSNLVIGTVICTIEPPLSDDDILAVFLLYIKSCEMLKQQIRDDYLQLLNNLITKHPDLFPLERFTQDDII
ncbi:17412_t:CDS:2 [Cetraspora pellucida]|uniref:17412_t:CDS:1 n=1 Tax=Cetraspora pellucida TaxID=1433469 RepID=A0A9N9CVD2_9GLOM|nr:17412_t:CDS:2 [Cetraspora pellucida]